MVPILLDFDQQTHDVELGFANQDLAIYNNLLAGIIAAIPSLTFNLTNFTQLMGDPAGYAFDFIVNGNPLTIGGAPISRDAAMTMVEITDDWKLIINLVNDVNADFTTKTVYKYLSAKRGNVQFNRLSITNMQISNNVFALTTAFTNSLTAKYSVYTKSDNQVNIYNAVNAVFTAFQQLQTVGGTVGSTMKLSDFGIIAPGGIPIQFIPSAYVGMHQ